MEYSQNNSSPSISVNSLRSESVRLRGVLDECLGVFSLILRVWIRFSDAIW